MSNQLLIGKDNVIEKPAGEIRKGDYIIDLLGVPHEVINAAEYDGGILIFLENVSAFEPKEAKVRVQRKD